MSDHAKELAVDTPDRIGVVPGYRQWSVAIVKGWPIEHSLRARHFLRGDPSIRVWNLDGPTTSKCPYKSCREGMKSPEFACPCGLHAHPSPLSTQERSKVEEYRPWSLDYMEVYGSVLAWGKIIHHADYSFFRAEKALPIAFVSNRVPKRLEQISERLAAPILPTIKELVKYTESEVKRWSA